MKILLTSLASVSAAVAVGAQQQQQPLLLDTPAPPTDVPALVGGGAGGDVPLLAELPLVAGLFGGDDPRPVAVVQSRQRQTDETQLRRLQSDLNKLREEVAATTSQLKRQAVRTDRAEQARVDAEAALSVAKARLAETEARARAVQEEVVEAERRVAIGRRVPQDPRLVEGVRNIRRADEFLGQARNVFTEDARPKRVKELMEQARNDGWDVLPAELAEERDAANERVYRLRLGEVGGGGGFASAEQPDETRAAGASGQSASVASRRSWTANPPAA